MRSDLKKKKSGRIELFPSVCGRIGSCCQAGSAPCLPATCIWILLCHFSFFIYLHLDMILFLSFFTSFILIRIFFSDIFSYEFSNLVYVLLSIHLFCANLQLFSQPCSVSLRLVHFSIFIIICSTFLIFHFFQNVALNLPLCKKSAAAFVGRTLIILHHVTWLRTIDVLKLGI